MDRYLSFISESGIQKGDILDVSSDLKEIILFCRRHNEIFDANKVLDSLKEAVGNEGTLLIRAWNWDFCHNLGFDINKSASQVGALGNIAMNRKDFMRTQHPIYSFMVWGKHAEKLVSLTNKSSFGSDSPFGFLTNNNGKQFMYGSDMYNSLTYVHFVEEQVGVHYRYLKDFTDKYVDKNGVCSIKTYSMNVRDLDLNIRMFSRKTAHLFQQTFEDLFTTEGILKKSQHENVFIGLLELKKAYRFIEDDIKHNRSKKICLYNGQ